MQEKIEVLETAKVYISRLKAGIEEAIGYLRMGQNEKAKVLNGQILEGLDWLIKALELTKDVQNTPIDFNKAVPMLGEMLDALENDDMILLADMYEYELIEKLDEWQTQIEGIA